MKKIFYLAAALTVLAGVASCEKNTETSQPQQQTGKFRQVTITAGSAQTKTYVEAGSLKWSANDKLNIVPQSGSVSAAALDIKSGVGEEYGIFEGQIDASITDATELYGWCGGSWTYSSGSFTVDMPATQTYVANGLAENAYPSIGIGTIKEGITLSNPMGVLKIPVKGATSNDKVKSITVTSAANNLAGSFSVDKNTYTVSGGNSKTVTLNVASPYAALSLTDSVNFYVVLPPATYAARDLLVTVTFSDDSYSISTFPDAVTVTAGNVTAEEVYDHTGRRGMLNGQEYVLIRAKYDGTNDSYLKWATQNLAVTTSGKAKWNGTDYQIGDYFQWAAYDGYVSGTKPENLVIYTSFTNNGSSGSFSGWKDSKKFNNASAPYYGGSSYTKYTGPSGDGMTVIEQADDVANIVLDSTWRIPTGGSDGEFKAMRAVTYWAWDGTDKGCYVFKPGVGTSGAANGKGNIAGTDDKTKALLFFPAAGHGNDANLINAGSFGYYWSSSLNSVYTYSAYRMDFGSYNVYLEYYYYRYYGFSVRPVSD